MDNETTKNFIENIIDEDNEKNTYGKRVPCPSSRRNRMAISTSATPSRFA